MVLDLRKHLYKSPVKKVAASECSSIFSNWHWNRITDRIQETPDTIKNVWSFIIMSHKNILNSFTIWWWDFWWFEKNTSKKCHWPTRGMWDAIDDLLFHCCPAKFNIVFHKTAIPRRTSHFLLLKKTLFNHFFLLKSKINLKSSKNALKKLRFCQTKKRWLFFSNRFDFARKKLY